MSDWGIFEPADTIMEQMFPIKNIVLREMYAHARREWWNECRWAQGLLVEASQYGPSNSGGNLSRAAEHLVRYEAALAAIRSADIQLRSPSTGKAT